MNLGYFNYPMPVNEPVHTYAPGSAEREALKKHWLN
jgi:1-pyrroline-5-carboxylate dehydrogenase